jgi:ATP-dependent Zn protease
MKIKEIILSYLKTIGIVILSFLGLILFGKLLLKKDKAQEKAKEAVKKTEESIDNSIEITETIKDNIDDAKEIIEQAREEKETIVSSLSERRKNKAEEAGFKKEE